MTFSGAVIGELEVGHMDAVNVVNLELYLRGVVPSEMPSSWSPAALQSQAVAARTYATRELRSPKASWFDVFGDTRDQSYGGVGAETKATNQAVKATAGEVVVDHTGHAILAQYASADGGWTVAGGAPYLPAKPDPYDGAVPNAAHAWITSVSAHSLAMAYPEIGTLQDIVITGRGRQRTVGRSGDQPRAARQQRFGIAVWNRLAVSRSDYEARGSARCRCPPRPAS